jgi:hypothetical protein
MRIVVCILGLLAPLSACQQSPQVPEDAKLLYFGPVTRATQIDEVLPLEKDDPPRQVYVYDDTTGKVVAVRTVDAQHRDLNFQWIPAHQYRVYFY